jgi:ABC-type multidrug transport system ATPase subunit
MEHSMNSMVEDLNQSKEKILICGRDLTIQFDERVVVDRVSFEISAGSIIGFIGPSGCVCSPGFTIQPPVKPVFLA